MPANAWIFALEALMNSVSSESGFGFFAVLRNRRAQAQNGETVLTGPPRGAFNKVPLGMVLPAHAPTGSQAITRCGHQVRALATRLPLTRMPCSVGRGISRRSTIFRRSRFDLAGAVRRRRVTRRYAGSMTREARGSRRESRKWDHH